MQMHKASRRLASVKGVADLVAYSYDLRHHDPVSMLVVARQAVEIAEAANTPTLLRAEAWANLGNALRVTGDLQDSGKALSRAEDFAEDLPWSFRAKLSRFWASWHMARHELDAARACLADAEALYLRQGDSCSVALCKIKEAASWNYSGDPHRAWKCILRAIPHIGSDRDLLRAAWETGVWALVEGDWVSEAVALLALGREVLREGGAAFRLKVSWAEGLIAARLGNLAILEGVRDSYISAGSVLQAAQVALDLARYAVLSGDRKRYEENASVASPVLAVCGISVPTTAGQLAAARRYLASCPDQGFGLGQVTG